MSILSENIREDFETYGINASSEKVLVKCTDLCKSYKLTSEQIAVSWLSFSTIHSLDELTIDALELFEREELRKGSQSQTLKEDIHSLKTNCNEDELLATYGTSPPLIKNEQFCTPTRKNKAKRDLAFENSIEKAKNAFLPSVPLSPAVSSPSQKYSSRVNSGQVVCSFGSNDQQVTLDTQPPSFHVEPIECPCGGDSPLISAYQHMFEKLRDIGEILDDSIHYLGDQLKEELSLEEWAPLNIPSNEAVWCLGRICCDSLGKLNSSSVLLEGSREQSGQAMKIDLSRLSSYSLFPGQIVAIKGINTSGSKLIAEEIIPGKMLTFPQQLSNSISNLDIRVACGPFTTSENLLFEPLDDFLSLVATKPPHALILLGPLLDASHPLLDSANDTYDSIVSNCLLKISTALADTDTLVFIVASARDVSCPLVYPTPPVFLNGTVPQSGGRIKILPDPSLLSFDGFTVAISSTDTLMHISKEEISFPPQSGDRLARLSQHLLNQQSFYPLYPPTEGLCMNLEQADVHTRLPFLPHLFILPSDFRGFIKDVSKCIIVNPERLSKGTVGGCFAHLQIYSTEDSKCTITGKVVKI